MMPTEKEIGTIAECNRKVLFEWEIRDFFSYTEQNSRYYSPPFAFLDSAWQIEMWPNFLSNDNPTDYVSLYLSKINNRTAKNVHLTFAIKTAENFLAHQKGKSCTFFDQGLGWAQFIHRCTLLELKERLVPSGTLTVCCSLVIKTNEQYFIARPDKLAEDLREMFNKKRDSDVTFKINEDTISAHKSILSARCAAFTAMFENEMIEKETGVVIITDCDIEAFNAFLLYIYCGEVEFKKCDPFLLYKVAHKYRVPELMAICVDFAIRKLSVETVCETFVFANQFNEHKLLAYVQQFFTHNLQQIISSTPWKDLLKEDFELANQLLQGMFNKNANVIDKKESSAECESEFPLNMTVNRNSYSEDE